MLAVYDPSTQRFARSNDYDLWIVDATVSVANSNPQTCRTVSDLG